MFEQMTPALKQNRSSIISSDCCVSNQHCLMNTSPQRIKLTPTMRTSDETKGARNDETVCLVLVVQWTANKESG